MRIRNLILKSVLDPGLISKKVDSFKLDFFELFQALIFVSISSVLMTYLTFWLPSILFNKTLDQRGPVLSLVTDNPFGFVFLQCLIMIIISLIVAFGGKFFNGVGNFSDSLKGVLWINFILVITNLMQVLLIISIPFLADLLAISASFWSIWALVVFSKELHGFDSLAVTGFVGLLLFSLTVFILGFLFTFFGLVVIEGI